MPRTSFHIVLVERRCKVAMLVIFSLAVLLSGCAERKVHAYRWPSAGQLRPNPPSAQAADNSPDIAPDFGIAVPENNSKIFGVRPTPARPRVESSRPSASTNNSNSPALVPELSPQETAAAQQQFSESVSIADKNVAQAKNRTLNRVQMEIVAKIKAFLAEAREASSEGDWGRARNLAKKAQILSEDLADSF